METRVLTLFDDDFFPEEKPREKPKKEKAPKPGAAAAEEASDDDVHTPTEEQESVTSGASGAVLPGAADQGSLHQEEETVPAKPETISGIHKEWPSAPATFSAPEISIGNAPQQPATTDAAPFPQQEAPQAATEEPATDDVDAANDAPEAFADDSIGSLTTEETEVHAPSAEPETSEAPGEEDAAEKELNQQLLSELIQLDYTALLQKDYAFDLSNATIISKELPGKNKPEPIAAGSMEEEDPEEEQVFEEVTPLPEWKLDKKYYTIGEVAQLFQVNTSHIRFWTNEFKLKPRTTRKGDRLYSPKDIAELRLIHHLVKVKKHTIKGAREKLKSEKSGVNNKLDLKDALIQLKETLLKIREQL